MPHTPALEIAVQDPAGVRIAAAVGAARVELAQALALGGITPSPATLETAVETAAGSGVEVHVLVRPRAGGFHYDRDEIALTERDVRRAVEAGAHGVVIGALDAAGDLDLDAMARLRDAAEGRIEIMAGSGVDAASARALADTGVDALHFSAKRTVPASGGVRMGSAADGVGGHEVTDLATARALIAALS